MTLKNVLTILDEPQHPARALSRAIDIQGKSGCHLDLVSFCWHSMGNAKEVFDKQQLGAIRDEVVGQRDMLAEQGFSTRDISLQTAWTDNIARWVEKKTTAKSCDLLVKSINKSKTLTHTPLDWQLLRTCPAPMLFATTKQNRTKKGGKVL